MRQAVAGLVADGRQIAIRARSESTNYTEFYAEPITVRSLCDRVAGFIHAYTLYGSVRPFGCSVILAGVDDKGPQLYLVEPSGVSYVCFLPKTVGILWLRNWKGQAAGKDRN